MIMNDLFLINQMPIKLLGPHFLHGFYPHHVKTILTDNCNSKCSFCNAKAINSLNRDMPFDDFRALLSNLKSLGTKAISFEGGGEPTVYPYFLKAALAVYRENIDLGLITNGKRLENVSSVLPFFTWCRISFSDEYKNIDDTFSVLHNLLKYCCNTDFSFNFVDLNIDTDAFHKAEEFVINHPEMLGMRVTGEQYSKIRNTKKSNCNRIYITESRFIMDQELRDGDRKCLLGLIRPLITPDLSVFPCCAIIEDGGTFKSYGENILTVTQKQMKYNCDEILCPFNQTRLILNEYKNVRHPNFI